MINFDPTYLSPNFSFRDSIVTLPAMNNILIAPANLSRVLLMFQSVVSAWTARPIKSGAANIGWTTTVASQILTFDFATYGSIVGMQWYAFSPGAGGALYVAEIIYIPIGQ